LIWSASKRVALSSGPLRLAALVAYLLTKQGMGVRHVAPTDTELRLKSISWLLQHDPLFPLISAHLRVDRDPLDPRRPIGGDLALSDDAARLGLHCPATTFSAPWRVMWIGDSTTSALEPRTALGAVTLTEFEAKRLRAEGIDAVSLFRWPDFGDLAIPTDRPLRAVVSVDWVEEASLALVLDWLISLGASGMGTEINLLPDSSITVGQRSYGPMHPFAAHRRLASADLVIGLGNGPAVDLHLAEAALLGRPVLRLTNRAADSLTTVQPAGIAILPELAPSDDFAEVLKRAPLPASLRVGTMDLPTSHGFGCPWNSVNDLLGRASAPSAGSPSQKPGSTSGFGNLIAEDA
jgi:hypothetical protein